MNIQLSGVAQTADLIPGTPYVFVVVREGTNLGFELVDLDRNLSLSRMVVLGNVPPVQFTWPNGDECQEDLDGQEHCPVQLQIDEKTLVAILSYGGREQFLVPLSVDDWISDIDKTLRWNPTGELARELGLEPGAGVAPIEKVNLLTDIEVCTDTDVFKPES